MRRFVNTTIVVFRSFVLILTNALTGWVHIFNLCRNTVERDSQLTSESCGKIKFRKAIGLRGLEKVLPKSPERLFQKKKKLFGRRPNVHITWRQVQECSAACERIQRIQLNRYWTRCYFWTECNVVSLSIYAPFKNKYSTEFVHKPRCISAFTSYIMNVWPPSKQPFFFRKRRSNDFGSKIVCGNTKSTFCRSCHFRRIPFLDNWLLSAQIFREWMLKYKV